MFIGKYVSTSKGEPRQRKKWYVKHKSNGFHCAELEPSDISVVKIKLIKQTVISSIDNNAFPNASIPMPAGA